MLFSNKEEQITKTCNTDESQKYTKLGLPWWCSG